MKSAATHQTPKPTTAHAVGDDDMHFTIECPNCLYEHEYRGWFDSSDTDQCRKCNTLFRAEKLIMQNGDTIV